MFEEILILGRQKGMDNPVGNSVDRDKLSALIGELRHESTVSIKHPRRHRRLEISEVRMIR